jgi:hypothetical protein
MLNNQAMETTDYQKQATDFLEKTGTKFTATFKEFGSMSWDKKGEKRNIFNITLENLQGSYSFEFGSSIADSCQTVQVPITEVQEEIEVFSGLGIQDKSVSASVKFKLYKKEGFELSEERIAQLVNDFMFDGNASVSRWNEEINAKFKKGQISANYRDEQLSKGFKEGAAMQCIQKAVRQVLSKKVESHIRAESIVPPTAYDVITCLQKYDVGTFENFCGDFGYDEDSRTAERTYKAVVEEYEALSNMYTPEELEEMQEIQ